MVSCKQCIHESMCRMKYNFWVFWHESLRGRLDIRDDPINKFFNVMAECCTKFEKEASG